MAEDIYSKLVGFHWNGDADTDNTFNIYIKLIECMNKEFITDGWQNNWNDMDTDGWKHVWNGLGTLLFYI